MTFEELSDEFQVLKDLIHETFFNEDGTEKPVDDSSRKAVSDLVDEWAGALKHKAERSLKFIVELENQASSWEAEAKRYGERAKKNRNIAERVKWLIGQAMDKIGIAKLDAGVFQVSSVEGPPAMIVHDENKVPDKYFITERVLVKSTLKEDLLAGFVTWDGIPGAIISRKKYLRIK